MNKAYLLIGGNTGDRRLMLQQAIQAIHEKAGNILAQSPIYETAAWGKTDQATFLNQALAIETALDPNNLLQSLLNIEKDLGRIREEKYGPRTIDIDILLYNDLHLVTENLVIPHPELANRRFALTPLADIAPGLKHPVLHDTMQSLLKHCKDELPVNIAD